MSRHTVPPFPGAHCRHTLFCWTVQIQLTVSGTRCLPGQQALPIPPTAKLDVDVPGPVLHWSLTGRKHLRKSAPEDFHATALRVNTLVHETLRLTLRRRSPVRLARAILKLSALWSDVSVATQDVDIDACFKSSLSFLVKGVHLIKKSTLLEYMCSCDVIHLPVVSDAVCRRNDEGLRFLTVARNARAGTANLSRKCTKV